MDDLTTHLCPVYQRRRVLHMATHAEFVLDRDHSVSTFGREEPGIAKEKILIETLRQLLTIDLSLFQSFP